MHIVYSDPYRAVRARFILREGGVESSPVVIVPMAGAVGTVRGHVIEVANEDAEHAKDILSLHDLLGTVGGQD